MASETRIRKLFGHKLIGTKFLKNIVISTVLVLPPETAEFIAKKCWFVGSFTDGWAFTLKHEDLKKGEYFIFLSDELLDQHVGQIRWTIMHEIGHAVLGHKNSIGHVQTKAEVRKQESEADEFARKYLS